MAEEDLAKRVLKGDRLAISRAITVLEDGLPGSNMLYRRLSRVAWKTFIVGVAGPPGAGKSTLINCLIKKFRENNSKVGVVAVDPSSQMSGGALMGDRVRMLEHSLDMGVFIRSMASRGDLGGVSSATTKTILVLNAAGYDYVFVETVGVGQTELDIAKVADMTVVVLMPQMGDEVQAMKAGLIEIGDIFVVNKAELDGADRAVLQLTLAVREKDGWKPPVVRTSAQRCVGVHDLVETIQKFKSKVTPEKRLQIRRTRAREELIRAFKKRIEAVVKEKLDANGILDRLAEEVLSGRSDPETAVSELIFQVFSPKNRV